MDCFHRACLTLPEKWPEAGKKHRVMNSITVEQLEELDQYFTVYVSNHRGNKTRGVQNEVWKEYFYGAAKDEVALNEGLIREAQSAKQLQHVTHPAGGSSSARRNLILLGTCTW
jgi:hypothetical protein